VPGICGSGTGGAGDGGGTGSGERPGSGGAGSGGIGSGGLGGGVGSATPPGPEAGCSADGGETAGKGLTAVSLPAARAGKPQALRASDT
jgi:hypothetical protein